MVLIQRFVIVSYTEVVHGTVYSGHCRQVGLIQRLDIVSLRWFTEQSTCRGHCRQVVLIQRCVSITEVAHGAAYSGLCR